MKQRVIALIDCDSFYVSCERKDNIGLIGKPVCVMTSNSDRGIIVSRSKEAKNLGIKMGAPYFQIKDAYKDVICMAARMDRYAQISQAVMDVIRKFSPDVEVVSVDEAYIDITGLDKVYKADYVSIVQNIRNTIWNKVKIPVSIGLSCSKILAKLASDKAKYTGGIFVIKPNQILDIIGNEEISAICGIGHKNFEHLNYNGVVTVNDFIKRDNVWIKKLLGIRGLNLKQELLGVATSLVNKQPVAPKSIQDTKSFDDFTSDVEFLQSALNHHVHVACKKLRMWNGYCKGIEVVLKTKDFKLLTVETKFENPTNSDFEIKDKAQKLLRMLYRHNFIYRSVGIVLKNITYDKFIAQSLFEQIKPNDDRLSRIIDGLEEKFGDGIVKLGM